MAITEYARQLAGVAIEEHAEFHDVPETDRRLRARIYDTYIADLAAAAPGASLGWNVPNRIGAWAWSATFVSWCILKAGANAAEFDFSIRHAIFIRAAIANEDAGRGVFRAREIDAHAPRIGDIICNNRSGGRVTYERARNLDSYDSHSAIVVELIERRGRRYAVTIGGNEGDSIRRTEVELTSAGLVRQRSSDPYICIIATDKPALNNANLAAVARAPAPPALSRSLRGHGTFIYDAVATIADYGDAAQVAAAMTRARMTHAWVRVAGRQPIGSAQRRATEDIVAAATAAGIAVAGWAWAQGEDAKGEARNALKQLAAFGLTDFIADIEPGHNNSVWTRDEIATFCDHVRTNLNGSFALSSFALVDWHEPHLMRAALPYVDAFAPQIYWFNFPNRRMVEQFTPPGGGTYRRDDPGAYADLCLDRWTNLAAASPKPLILTGQAYWGEGNFTQSQAEQKLKDFLRGWNGYARLAGLNWWHFGGGDGMSHAMLEAITAADIQKQFP